ncbi:glycoside hydrolase family 15 protein [Haloarchaeobius sp. HRN-SO-5]|uniref:glycoside hydrolase family 15 protein n=1 Tax=Haloarchaeobius sp. HRN-SO-5 TaxID=3446118 RepID=UPI003EBBA31C
MLASLATSCVTGLAGCGASGRDDGDEQTDGTEPTRTDGGEARPRADPQWTTGEKYGVGTVADHGESDPSRVWFTLTDGALTEPRFPRIDLLNARHVSFLVADGEGYVARTHAPPGTDDALERRVDPVESDALAFRQTVTDPDRDWTLTVEHVADPNRDALLVDVTFEAAVPLDLFVVATPTPSGRAAHTAAERRPVADGEGSGLVAVDTGDDGIVMTDADGDPHVVALALAADGGFDWASAGESSAPETRALLDEGRTVDAATTAEGVVTFGGRLADGATTASRTLALGFATGGDADAALDTATAALDDGFGAARSGYVDSWRGYLDGVSVPESVAGDDALADQYRSAAMVLKAVEDKTYVGAGIASPSVPWGSRVSALQARDYGYNFVWARDLYQVFTAFDAMGDVRSAVDALEYVFAHQHDGDGFLPQNTFVDGRTRWGGEQLDEISFPLVMALQLRERHGYGFSDAGYDYDSVRALAEYVVHGGPRTEQERWEEEDGYSPSTIAAAVAGLASAASLAHDEGHGDDALAYLAVADHWQRSVDDWCATTTGTVDHEAPYYVRVSDDTDPDDGTARSLANGGPTLDERAVVDAGFLELVRLGVTPADDPVVRNSLAVVDDAIRVDTPNGPAWYRYNGDGYGELGPSGPHEAGTPWSVTREGRGRLWPLLTGERAEYELLAGTESGPLAPANLLRSMQRFANDGRMLPEQVWDRPGATAYDWEFGEGTGSATPLAWSMAQYVRLAHSLDAGAPVETPRFVSGRYVSGETPTPPTLDVSWPDSVVESSSVTVSGTTDATTVLVRTRTESIRTTPTDGAFAVDVPLDDGRNPVTVVAAGEGSFPDRGLAAAQRTVSFVE